MQFDEILKTVGEFGPYQLWIYILISLPCLFAGMHDVNPPFLLYVPKHRCKLPGYQNDTYKIQSPYHAELINQTIPRAVNEEHDYDQCNIYVTDTLGNRTIKGCSEWIYDKSVFTSTFVTEQNVVCGDNIFQVANMRMMNYLGKTVGGIGVGVLSDWKKIFCSCIIAMLVTTLGISWAPNKVVFSVLKFLYGICGIGVFTTAFILGMELVGQSKRVFSAMGVSFVYSGGMIILPGIGYWLRNWNTIEIAHFAPVALFLCYWIILPESPRWLISKGRKSEAKDIVMRIAASNRTINMMPKSSAFDDNEDETPRNTNTVCDLFKSSILMRGSMIAFFNTLVIGMVYYGFSLNVDNLVGNFYLNFFLTSIVDFPAYTLCLFLLNRIGRKKFFILSSTTGGVALLSTIFIILYVRQYVQGLILIMSLAGRFCVATGYAICFIWVGEISPTGLRHCGLATCAVCANIGTILSPYIAELNMVVGGRAGKVMPLMLFGAAILISGLLSISLPETHLNDLPETIQQAESIGRWKNSRNDENGQPRNVENACTKF